RKKRKWPWIVLGIFVLLIGTVVALPFVIDINKHREKIEALIEKQIHGDITIGGIYFSTFPYLGIRLENISLKNLPAPQSVFNGSEVLAFQEAALKVRFKSLFQRKIIAVFQMKAPSINILTHGEKMNATDLLPETKEEAKKEKTDLAALTQNKWVKNALIEEIRIQDGSLRYDASLLKPVQFAIQNIQIKDPTAPILIRFDTVMERTAIGFGSKLFVDLNSDKYQLKEGVADYGVYKLNFEGTYEKNILTLHNATSKIFDGDLAANGKINLKQTPAFLFSLDAKNLNVAKATDIATGTGFLTMDARGSGANAEIIKQTLNATGELKLIDGKINSLNLVKSIFSEEITGLITLALKGKDPTVILPGSKDEGQKYKEILMPFVVSDGRLHVSNLQMQQEGYTGQMQGTIGFDMTADLQGRFFLSKENSATLFPDEQVRGYVTDEQGQFVVPFKIRGPLAGPSVTPDASYVKTLAVRAAQKAYKEEGEQLLKEKGQEILQDIFQ
ncbi:MAG: AsmA-like C-terminal region-containing protein, partial [Deltaproteobacteria bacterium]|nr:AsmA-like C-terminal region-containing protein [Deltaproteobacteria bacterium]